MTTEAAERLYMAQHLFEMEGKPYAVFNPLNKPVDELPVIIGFNNGGGGHFYEAVAISEDGVVLGGHCCSHEAYMRHDLGILAGTRPDRHEESYQKHYPEGYRMAFVVYEETKTNEALQAAFKAHAAKNPPVEQSVEPS